jgi:uncharacterized membrane protein YozB (DUF420 family)
MFTFLDGSGFLSEGSSAGADLTLLITIAALVMLTIGVGLARTGRYSAHRWVQTVAVILNTIPIVVWMIRSYWLFVRPNLPDNLGESVDLLTTVHAVTGLVGVALGLFVVIRANQLTARGESVARYKGLMRAAYIVYLLGTALGVWVYVAIYG